VAESSQKNASASTGKSSSSSGKKVIMKNYSRQGSSLFPIILDSLFYDFLLVTLPVMIYLEFKDLLCSYPSSKLLRTQDTYVVKSSLIGRIAAERLVEQEKVNA
jgi:hypothetical protein